MKFSSQIKLAILTFLMTLGLTIQPVHAENILDKFKQVSKFGTVKDKTVKENSEKIINRINQECCNDNFGKKNELIEIKSFLEQCLTDKCYVGIKNVLTSGKPKKLVAIENIDLAEKLLIENEKVALLKEKDDIEDLVKKIKKEKNLSQKQKEELEKVNKSNQQLKDKIEKMLLNYDKRVSELEKQIKNLEEENEKLFSDLPKYKQKKYKKD